MDKKLSYRLLCLFWDINRPTVYWFVKRKFNFFVASGSDKIPSPPFILMANHANFFDPWMVGYCSPTALYIMMNDDGFRGSKIQQWYLRKIGAFPKKKGARDYKAMKQTLGLLKKGFPVLLFPEGQTSWDGETQPIYGGVEKIVQRACCPLVMMHLQGNFLSRPWWAHSTRRGKIEIAIKLLDKKTVQEMPAQKLLDTIKSYIYNNDVKNEKNRNVSFSGNNLAQGLERFVWICRNCESEDTLVTHGNMVECSSCGAGWEMTPYCDFIPLKASVKKIGDFMDWSVWHKKKVKERLAEARDDKPLTQSRGVIMQTQNEESKFVKQASGTLELDRENISFTPAFEGAKPTRWPLEDVEDYVIQEKDIFEFRVDKKYFRFVFDKHSPMKWIFYLRYMNGFEEVEKRGYY